MRSLIFVLYSIVVDCLSFNCLFGYWLLAAGYWQHQHKQGFSSLFKLPKARGQKPEADYFST